MKKLSIFINKLGEKMSGIFNHHQEGKFVNLLFKELSDSEKYPRILQSNRKSNKVETNS